ncbi:hypothetical protein YPPY99_0074, partial [Yersinia pestis PY-99]
MIKRLGSIGSQ